MPRTRQRHTTEGLLEMGREAAAVAGARFTLLGFTREWGVSETTIYKRFGSWPEFCRQLGLDERDPSDRRTSFAHLRRLSDEQFGRLAAEAVRQHGEYLTQEEFCRCSGVSKSTIARRFGTWGEFRTRFGISSRGTANLRNRKYTREELLDTLREVARSVGPDLTQAEFLSRAGVSSTTFYRHFRTWEEARHAIDLTAHGKPRRRYSDEFLLADMDGVARTLGRLPTEADYRSQGHADPATLRKRFGPEWSDVQFRYERWLEYRRAFPPSVTERTSFAALGAEQRQAELDRLLKLH